MTVIKAVILSLRHRSRCGVLQGVSGAVALFKRGGTGTSDTRNSTGEKF